MQYRGLDDVPGGEDIRAEELDAGHAEWPRDAGGMDDGAGTLQRLNRGAEAREVSAHRLGARDRRHDDVDGAHLAPRGEQLVDDVPPEQAGCAGDDDRHAATRGGSAWMISIASSRSVSPSASGVRALA